MKTSDLKLYGKYKYTLDPNMVFIYIGVDCENYHMFLFKFEDYDIPFYLLKNYDFDPDKIVKDLNLETYNDNNYKCIKGYHWYPFEKESIETYLEPII